MLTHKLFATVLAAAFLAIGFGLTNAGEGKPNQGIDYAKWTALTREPVSVDQGLFLRCERSATTVKLEKELTEKYGPHFEPSLKYFANPDAEKSLKANPKGVLPVGSTIVKEKRVGKSNSEPLLAYGAMIKREPGYDPEHGDWEYVYADFSKGKPKIERGKIQSCINCHSIAKDRDYLYRTHLSNVDPKSSSKK